MSSNIKNRNKELFKAALAAAEKAYAPYSNFRVGAALLTKSSGVYLGANIENSAYGVTICAERVALYKAVFEGHKQFDALAVVAIRSTLPEPNPGIYESEQAELGISQDDKGLHQDNERLPSLSYLDDYGLQVEGRLSSAGNQFSKIKPRMSVRAEAFYRERSEAEATRKTPQIIETTEAAWPCGICRQAYAEFDLNISIITGPDEDHLMTSSLSDLLPHAFELNDKQE